MLASATITAIASGRTTATTARSSRTTRTARSRLRLGIERALNVASGLVVVWSGTLSSAADAVHGFRHDGESPMGDVVAACCAVSVRPELDPPQCGSDGVRARVIGRKASTLSSEFRDDFLDL